MQVSSKCYKETVNLQDKSKVNRRRKGETTTQPASNLARVAWELGYRAHLDEASVPTPQPPNPPTLGKRYAPRTYNLGNRDQDPRFCCRPEYGVQTTTHPQHGLVYIDEMGCIYDMDHMFNLDGLRDRNYRVDGLNAADNMNQLEPCDPYNSDTGLHLPPYPGDPIQQTGSYHR
jgi:hypothetical protein